MKKQLLLYLSITTTILITLYANISILNYQCDPFIPTTIIMGKCIENFGNVSESVNYINQISEFNAWQAHTKEYITYVPLSGITTYMISEIVNIPIIDVCYLPIPSIIHILILFCIMKLIYTSCIENFSIYEKSWRIYIKIVLFSSIYSFIGLYCIGKFHVFEYHGIYNIYILSIYFVLLKMILKKDRIFCSKSLIVIMPLFIANLYTHYNFPLTITGGMIIYIIVLKILKLINLNYTDNSLSSIKGFTTIFIIILSFQQFYYMRFSYSDSFLSTLNNLITNLTSRITETESSGTIASVLYPYTNYLIQFKINWHILFTLSTITITVLLIYYITTKKVSINSFLFIYILILGRDITQVFSYFSQYGGFYSIEIQDAWLLNSLLLFPIFLFLKTDQKQWKNIGLGFSIILLVSTILLIGWTTFETGINLGGYNAYPYQVKEETQPLSNFIISHTDEKKIVSGSMQATSKVYEEMYNYPLIKISRVYPKTAQEYIISKNKKHKKVTEIYKTLKEKNVSEFIITEYEINNGFYGGLIVSPLNEEETNLLKRTLETNENLIYDSKKAKLYKLRNS